jgi:hypothetical protein
MQILQKHAPALKIRAGHQARELILKEGLQPEQVDIVPVLQVDPKVLVFRDWIRPFLASFSHVLLSVEP